MKAIKRIAYQLDKPFYIWALTVGPEWAQNVTLVALWIYIPLLCLMVLGGERITDHTVEEAKKDPEVAKRYLRNDYLRWFLRIPTLATVVAAAAAAWF